MTDCNKPWVFEWDDIHKVPLDKIIKMAIEFKSDKIFRWDIGPEKACVVVGFEDKEEAYLYMHNEIYYSEEGDVVFQLLIFFYLFCFIFSILYII